jgi:predicted ArsR family transcriptional regulator
MLSPQTNLSSDQADPVRASDSELIQLLREGQPQTIDDLKRGLGVTATAVRQRIERLLEAGLIERQKVVAGRGRPVFRYALTVDGHRYAGADASEFAEAMWREIMLLRDSPIRKRLISSIARRLGRMYAERLGHRVSGGGGASESDANATSRSLEDRMRSLSLVLSRHQIQAGVHVAASKAAMLPVLDIGACPYPTLRDNPSDRSLCKMEEEMFSEALGAPVHLTSCRLDGDHCCQFSPVAVESTK